MALQRFLALISGKISETLPVQSSAGSSSNGAIVALNTAGQIDVTMLPSGLGASTAMLPATEALSAGAWVNVWNSGGTPSVRNADGSTTGKECSGYVLASVASAGTATVYFSGLNTSVTGQTAGPVYLSGTTAGQGSSTAPTATGTTLQVVGVAVSATSVDFAPGSPIARA